MDTNLFKTLTCVRDVMELLQWWQTMYFCGFSNFLKTRQEMTVEKGSWKLIKLLFYKGEDMKLIKPTAWKIFTWQVLLESFSTRRMLWNSTLSFAKFLWSSWQCSEWKPQTVSLSWKNYERVMMGKKN